METRKIRNWSRFQHFKDRRPPWIKLYRDLLDDQEWHALDGDAAKMLIMLWLLASEKGGEIPDNKTISFRLRIPLEQVDINMISLRYHFDIIPSQKISATDTPNSATDIEVPLRDREETETKTETEKRKSKRFIVPSVKEVAGYCIERGNSVDSQKFHDFYESNGWRVGKNPMKDWRATVRYWEKNSLPSFTGTHVSTAKPVQKAEIIGYIPPETPGPSKAETAAALEELQRQFGSGVKHEETTDDNT